MYKFGLIFFLLFIFDTYAGTLRPFHSDGCSIVPDTDLIIQKDISSCCVDHDFKYWMGGTIEDKENADDEFEQCLIGKGVDSIRAREYKVGVELGGAGFLSTPWRFGYGYSKPRNYSPLTKDELDQVEQYAPLKDLPIFLHHTLYVDELKDQYFSKNYCRESLFRGIELKFGKHVNKRETHIYRVKKNQPNTFQVFISECKGGFIIARFNEKYDMRNCFTNTFKKEKTLDSLSFYGSCSEF